MARDSLAALNTGDKSMDKKLPLRAGHPRKSAKPTPGEFYKAVLQMSGKLGQPPEENSKQSPQEAVSGLAS